MKGIALILLCCLLAAGKVTVQGFFAKKSVKTLSDGVFFNGMVFFFAMLIFLPWAFSASVPTIVYGACFGAITVAFQAFYIKAMSDGKASVAAMLVNLSMILPVTFSTLFLHEPFPPLRILGAVLTVAAVIITARDGQTVTGSRRWLVYALIASFLSGSLAILQKVYTTVATAQSQGFTAWSYIVATLITLPVYGILCKSGQKKTFTITWRAAFTALLTGAFLGTVMFLITYALTVVDGSIFFPSYYSGCLVLTTLSGVFILREKLKRNQIIGICIGVVALTLLNLP